MNVKVKICGIRSLATAQAAIDYGADFIGFNFVRTSKRFIDFYSCQTIIPYIKGKTKVVGVFQNAPDSQVNELADLLDLDFVQLHGNEDEIYIKKIKRPVIKSVNDSKDYQQLSATYFLLDRKEQGIGKMVDLLYAKKLSKKHNIFYAGGLTSENVRDVITAIKPFAIDVAGGIETNGMEDLEKIKKFITNAKGVIV